MKVIQSHLGEGGEAQAKSIVRRSMCKDPEVVEGQELFRETERQSEGWVIHMMWSGQITQGLLDFSAGCYPLSSKGHLVILQGHIQVISGFYTLQTILQLAFWKLYCCEFVSISGE